MVGLLELLFTLLCSKTGRIYFLIGLTLMSGMDALEN